MGRRHLNAENEHPAAAGGLFNLTIERLINQDLTRDEMSGVRVPVLGSVKAGYDHLAEQIVEDYEWVSPDEARGGEYFYLDVVGDSMKTPGLRKATACISIVRIPWITADRRRPAGKRRSNA